MTERESESGSTPLTFVLLALDVVVFILADRLGPTNEVKTLLRAGAVERYHVWLGESWRLVTPMVLHVGLAHLVWNGYAAIGWSREVERTLGSLRFLLVFFLGGLGASAASVIGHDTVTAAASGATFAVTGAFLAIRVRRGGGLDGFLGDGTTRRTLLTMAIWCGIGVWLGFDPYAHAGGLVVGFALTLVLTGGERVARRRGFALFAIALLTLLAFARRPWWTPSVADGERLTWYGASYFAGEKLTKDPTRALRFSTAACKASSADGCALVGFMYAKGEPVAKDDQAAARYFDEACTGKSAFGCAALGRVTMLGLGVARDPVKAAKDFSTACDLGQNDGCAGYGIALHQGLGVAKDADRGLEIAQQSCQAGSLIACRFLLDPEAPPTWE